MNPWLPVGTWMLVIFVLSGDEFSADNTRGLIAWLLRLAAPDLDPQRFELLHGVVRKLAHVTEYAILGALALRALRISCPRWRPRRAVAAALALAVACAAADETRQAFAAARTGSPFDVLLDSGGALIGAVLPVTLLRRRPAA